MHSYIYLNIFQISTIWKIIKTMYGEEYLQNSLNSLPTNRDDGLSHNNLPNGVDVDIDQNSKGGDTPAAHCSGGDDETETEDQTDHLGLYSNCFPSCYNARTGLPKGDFSFGENELDMDLDDFRNGFRGSQHVIMPQQQTWGVFERYYYFTESY